MNCCGIFKADQVDRRRLYNGLVDDFLVKRTKASHNSLTFSISQLIAY